MVVLLAGSSMHSSRLSASKKRSVKSKKELCDMRCDMMKDEGVHAFRTKTDVCLIDVEVALERTKKRHV